MASLSVALDATPLLGVRTGVGRYVSSLVDALVALEGAQLDLGLTAFTWRTGGRPAVPGARWRSRPVPARALRAAWTRSRQPPVELLSGRCDVFHGTNFVLPPTRRAVGVVTIHDLAFLRFPETVSRASQAYRTMVPAGLQRAARVLCPSQAVADEVAHEYALPPEQVLATPLGVDAGWSRARPPAAPDRARMALPDRYVLFVGTREPRKDLPTLLAAHRAARSQAPADVPPLLLVGPPGWGPEHAGVGDASGAGPGRSHPAADVVLSGFLAEADLRSVVAGATCLVLPSVYEGFGLPVLEALACGVPVLASDLPVLREVGGSVCTYAPVRDVDAFAAGLVALCREPGDPTLRRAQAAPFTWRACATATLAAYRQARATML